MAMARRDLREIAARFDEDLSEFQAEYRALRCESVRYRAIEAALAPRFDPSNHLWLN